MYDVFISYSTENEAEVDLIRRRLEDVGISCWFAPKEIHGHEDFTKVIPQAIRNSKAFLLLMSESAQVSKWVVRELGEADACDLPIYTLFLEPCQMDERFRFILRFSQHYDATAGLELQLSRLIHDLVKNNLEHEKTNAPKPKKKPLWPWLVAGVAVVALAVILLLVFGGGGGLQDGKYVLWVQAYDVALSGETAKNEHYLAGEKVVSKGGELVDHSQTCVWQLTFRDEDTVTISRDGVPLGTEGSQKGVGLGGKNDQIYWTLLPQEDGTYRIQNEDNGFYLEWYVDKNNWSVYHEVTPQNEAWFAITLTPVK